MSKRKLAPGARFSTRNASKYIVDPHGVPSMERVTPERIQQIDPDGERALALMKKFSRKD